MGKLDKSFIFKKCKLFLNEKYGTEKSKAIWFAANKEFNLLLREKKNIGSDEKMMVLPLCALYTTMKKMGMDDALDVLKEYGARTGNDISKMLYKLTSFPGLSKLLWKNMPKLMRITSSPKKGYKRRIISETRELVGVDILRCPLCETAKSLGVPEVTEVICLIDKGQMTGFRYIDYTRTKALGNGDDFCDYRLRFDKSKK